MRVGLLKNQQQRLPKEVAFLLRLWATKLQDLGTWDAEKLSKLLARLFISSTMRPISFRGGILARTADTTSLWLDLRIKKEQPSLRARSMPNLAAIASPVETKTDKGSRFVAARTTSLWFQSTMPKPHT